MLVEKIQNNNLQFNGKLRMYNCHKNRWFSKDTTAAEDKILEDLFVMLTPNLTRVDIPFYEQYKGIMGHKDLLYFIKRFAKESKGVNLPKPYEKSFALVNYSKNPIFKHGSYDVNVDQTFFLIHSFDKKA